MTARNGSAESHGSLVRRVGHPATSNDDPPGPLAA